MKVAAAQIECRQGSIAENLAMHLDMIAAAKARGVELVVFPELSLTDYLAAPDVQALARPRDCAELRALADAAGSLWISVGFVEAGDDAALAHTALTYGLPIVMTNHCGVRAGFDFWGGSRILDADGRVMVRASHRPELVIADIERDKVAAARCRLPTSRDADPLLFQSELARINERGTARGDSP